MRTSLRVIGELSDLSVSARLDIDALVAQVEPYGCGTARGTTAGFVQGCCHMEDEMRNIALGAGIACAGLASRRAAKYRVRAPKFTLVHPIRNACRISAMSLLIGSIGAAQ